jgi:putative addiction module CopG family antidote
MIGSFPSPPPPHPAHGYRQNAPPGSENIWREGLFLRSGGAFWHSPESELGAVAARVLGVTVLRSWHGRTAIALQISPHLQETIDRLIATGHYADAGEVLGAALQLLDEQERKLDWLRAELAIGEEQEKRGELIDLTPERFNAIKRQAIENVRAARPIKDAVKP